MKVVTETFRRQLRQESEKWWAEGLINSEFYETLAERYQFNTLEQDASSRFTVILIGLGSILLGLGVITFVAANWQEWSRAFRVVLLLSLFVGVNAAGFYLWRRPAHQRGFQKLGHGLLLLGALILGANMALISQMFHQSGNFYELLLVWGLGVVAMAYSLRLPSLGVVSLILVGWGYCLGWGSWSLGQDFSVSQVIVRHMPLIASLVFVPLAYWCRSRVIFALGAILVSGSLIFNLRPLAGWAYGHVLSAGWIAAIAFALPPALLWSYDRGMWLWLRRMRSASVGTMSESRSELRSELRSTSSSDPFQPIARSLAIWCLGIVFYVFAFYWLWNTSESDYYPLYQWNWEPLIDATILAIFAGLGWMQLRSHVWRSVRVQEKAVNTGMVASMILTTSILFIVHFESNGIPGFATFSFNVMLFLLAIGLIRDGLALGMRHTFWGGMVLLVLGIVSRMLEYNTGLLLKSIVFILCGVGVILSGLWFERRIHPQTHSRNRPSLPSQEGTP